MSKRFQKWWGLGRAGCKVWKERRKVFGVRKSMHNSVQTKPTQEGTQGVGSSAGSPGWRAGWHLKGPLDGKMLVHLWRGRRGGCHSEPCATVLQVMCSPRRWPIPVSAPTSNSLCQKGPWPYPSSPHLNSTLPWHEMWVQIRMKNNLPLSMFTNLAESQFPQQNNAPHCV